MANLAKTVVPTRKRADFFQAVYDGLTETERLIFGVRSPNHLNTLWPQLVFWGIIGQTPLGQTVTQALEQGTLRKRGRGIATGWPRKLEALEEPKAYTEPYVLGAGEKLEDHADALTPEAALLEALSGEITREQFEEMLLALGCTRKGAALFEKKGIYESIRVELGDNAVTVNEKKLRGNCYGLGRLTLSDRGDSIWHHAYVIVGWGLQADHYKGMTGRLFADLPNVWQGQNAYAANQVRDAKDESRLVVLKAKLDHSSQLCLSESKDALDLVEPMKQTLAAGIAVAPHHQGKYLVLGRGANAMGVGMANGKLRVFPYANKASKVFARLKTTSANVCESPDLEQSPLRMGTPGEEYGFPGRRYTVAHVHSPLLNEGDGTIILAPGETIPTVGKRELKVKLESPTGLKEGAAVAEARSRLKIASEVDWNAPAIWVDGRAESHWPVAHPAAIIKAETSVKWEPNTAGVEVRVTYGWVCQGTREKLNGFNVKGTTRTMAIGMANQPQLVLPPNAVKGINADHSIWACELPEGLLVGPQGLTAAQASEFDGWRKAKTTVEPITHAIEDRACYAQFLALYNNHPDWSFADDGKTITHNAKVLRGEIVLATEASSTIEQVTTSDLFSEMLFGVAAVCEPFAQSLWKDTNGKYRHILNLAAAIQAEGQGQKVIGMEDLKSDAKSTRLVIKELATQYPGTVTVQAGNEGVSLNFQALLALENWQPGGSTKGPSNIIAEVARLSDVSDVSFLEGKIRQIRGLQKRMVSPGKGLASILRCGKLGSRKVASGFSVPQGEVWVNPDDPAVKAGLLHDGEFHLVGRMPMIKFIGGTLKLNPAAPVGTFLVNAIDWVIANFGDVDGDAAVNLLVPKAWVEQVKDGLNNSVFGMGGYKAVFGADKWVDDLFKAKDDKAPDSSAFDGYQAVEIDADQWVKTYEFTVKHYRLVGLGYGVAARTLYSLMLRKDKNEETERACVYAWLSLYEDLGLSGYTEAGYDKLETLGKLAKDYNSYPELRSSLVDVMVQVFNDGDTVIDTILAEKLLKMAANHVMSQGLTVAENAEQMFAATFAFVRSASKGRTNPLLWLIPPALVAKFKGTLFGDFLDKAVTVHQAILPLIENAQAEAEFDF